MSVVLCESPEMGESLASMPSMSGCSAHRMAARWAFRLIAQLHGAPSLLGLSASHLSALLCLHSAAT